MRIAERALIGLLLPSIPLLVALAWPSTPERQEAPTIPAVPTKSETPLPTKQHGCKQARPKPIAQNCHASMAVDLEQTAAKNAPAIRKCVQRAKQKGELVEATKVIVTASIDVDGRFAGVSLDQLGDTGVGRCITKVIHGWKMPAPGCEGRVRFALAFE